MEENKTAEATKPIDDVKPLVPSAPSSAADLSNEQPVVPPQSTTESPEAAKPVAPASTSVMAVPPSETTKDATQAGQLEVNSQESAPSPTTRDNGTHRSTITTGVKGKSLAGLILAVGTMLCGFVIYVFVSTN